MRTMKLMLALSLLLLCATLLLCACSAPAATGADTPKAATSDAAGKYNNSSNGGISTASAEESAQRATINLTGYRVVYPAEASEAFVAHVTRLAGAIELLTGTSVPVVADSAAETAKEIVVGNTARAISATVKSGVTNGYRVEISGQKIAIAGTNNLFALIGVDYLMENYLTANAVARASLPITVSASFEVITLDGYTVVYDDALDTTTDEEEDPYVDFESVSKTDLTFTLASDLSTATGFSLADDTSVINKAILVGTPDAYASVINSALSEICGKDEYLIAVRDGRVILSGWSLQGVNSAAQRFTQYLADATTDAVITLPQGLSFHASADERWFTDSEVPFPALPLVASADVADGSLLYVYKGDGVNVGAYNSYCTGLTGKGYTLLTDSSAEGSFFATYVNYHTGHVLHVSYNAFTHHAELVGNHSASNTDPYNAADYDPQLRIISSSLFATDLPSLEMLSPEQSYEKVTDSKITLVSLPDASVGTGYVMMLEDGRFIVIDGGGNAKIGAVADRMERDILWKVMSNLYQSVHGKEPADADGERIEIAAWIITHGHYDHYLGFSDFCATYGGGTSGSSKVEIEYLITNYPTWNQIQNTGEIYTWDTGFHEYYDKNTGTYKNGADKINASVKYGYTHIKIHTGQTLYFANVKIETLFTHEDLYPQNIINVNDTSTINRLSFVSTANGKNEIVTLNADAWDETSGDKAEVTTFLSTGDAYLISSRWMCAMYGDFLKSDMVYLAHHGSIGAEYFFYEKVAPTAVLWNFVQSNVYSTYLSDSNWYSEVSQKVFYTLASVKYVFLADDSDTDDNTEPNTHTTISLSTSGPLYDSVTDALTGSSITVNSMTRNFIYFLTSKPIAIKWK